MISHTLSGSTILVKDKHGNILKKLTFDNCKRICKEENNDFTAEFDYSNGLIRISKYDINKFSEPLGLEPSKIQLHNISQGFLEISIDIVNENVTVQDGHFAWNYLPGRVEVTVLMTF